MKHLMTETNDQLVTPKAKFVAQNLIFRHLTQLDGRKEELYNAFEDDMASLVSFHREIKRWRVRLESSFTGTKHVYMEPDIISNNIVKNEHMSLLVPLNLSCVLA